MTVASTSSRAGEKRNAFQKAEIANKSVKTTPEHALLINRKFKGSNSSNKPGQEKGPSPPAMTAANTCPRLPPIKK